MKDFEATIPLTAKKMIKANSLEEAKKEILKEIQDDCPDMEEDGMSLHVHADKVTVRELK
jgi:hypothetical protein